MRVIVCGSRNWNDRTRIANRLFDLPPDTTVVTGGSGNADNMAHQEAEKLGLLTEVHRYQPFISPTVSGKRAPLVRNAHMADLGADLCIAFTLGTSGTRNMIQEAEKRGIPVEVITA